MGDMDRSDLQQLSKEQLIDLVLRASATPQEFAHVVQASFDGQEEKRENSRPGGAKPGHEPHNRQLADDLMSFATTFRAFARRVAALFRPTSIGN